MGIGIDQSGQQFETLGTYQRSSPDVNLNDLGKDGAFVSSSRYVRSRLAGGSTRFSSCRLLTEPTAYLYHFHLHMELPT